MKNTWWIVVCRIAYDDEDTTLIFHTTTEEKALEKAETSMREAADDFANEFFVNYVIHCPGDGGRPVVAIGRQV